MVLLAGSLARTREDNGFTGLAYWEAGNLVNRPAGRNSRNPTIDLAWQVQEGRCSRSARQLRDDVQAGISQGTLQRDGNLSKASSAIFRIANGLVPVRPVPLSEGFEALLFPFSVVRNSVVRNCALFQS